MSFRNATLGSYGVTGFAGGPVTRLLDRLDLAHPSLQVRLDGGLDLELDLDVALGTVPRRRGGPTGQFRDPLRRPTNTRPRGDASSLPPWAGLPRAAGRRAAAGGPGRPDRDPAAGSGRQRDGRRLMRRRACDGAGLLGAFRAAVANLAVHVDEVNSLNVYPVPDGDTGATCSRRSGRRSTRPRRSRAAVRPIRRGDQLRGPDGRPRQLGRDLSPDLPRDGRSLGGKRVASTASTLPTRCRWAADRVPRGATPVEGTILTVIRESAAAAVVAAEHDGDRRRPDGDGRRRRAPRSLALPASCPSCARRGSSTRGDRASTGSSRARCCT